MIDRAEASDPHLLELLRAHPRVSAVMEGGGPGVRFSRGNWHREVRIGDASLEVAGLVELIDNNPLVCADVSSVPDRAATLALTALGPLIKAGVIAERPTMLANFEAESEGVEAFLQKEGWPDGLTLSSQPMDFGAVLAATVIAAVRTPSRLEDIDDLYAEAYGRSFFVRREEASEWDVKLVAGKPHAAFRLRISPDEPQSLLTIQVMAEKDGKCGAAQVVHCMNVMAGFEETLGVS